MKVSVLMITYNHDKYIAQAIESVLKQRVNFEYELVIGEDCSTDNTLDIILGYQEKYPNIIKVLPSKKNLGQQKNLIRTFQNCQGEYLAFIEGDDYWLSPDKLQKQVVFLDNHPECTFCFHDVYVLNDNSQEKTLHSEKRFLAKKDFYTLDDLIDRYIIPTCSTLFRKSVLKDFPVWFEKILMGMRVLCYFSAQYGLIGYIDEIMAVYRIHSGGVYTSLDHIGRLKAEIHFFQNINAYLDEKYSERIKKELTKYWKALKTSLEEYGFQLGLENVDLKNIELIFEKWPPDLSISARWKSSIIGNIYERLLYKYYSSGQLEKARYCWHNLLKSNPQKIFNRGITVIGIEASIGRRVANTLRRLF